MKSKRTFFPFAVLIILLLLLGIALINIYTDWLLFDELQYKSVFMKVFSTRLFLGLIYGLLSLAFIMINIIIANRTHFAPIDLFFDGQTKVSLNIALMWVLTILFSEKISGFIFLIFPGLNPLKILRASLSS